MLKVEIDADELEGFALALDKAPESLRKNMLEAMKASLRDVLKGAMDRVRVRKGGLRRSITAAAEPNSYGGFDGRVGTNLVYARIEELGYQGDETVRQYSRRVRGRDVREARKIVATGLGIVRTHKRRINRQGHPYLAPALESSRAAIVAHHVAAVAKTLDEIKAGK